MKTLLESTKIFDNPADIGMLLKFYSESESSFLTYGKKNVSQILILTHDHDIKNSSCCSRFIKHKQDFSFNAINISGLPLNGLSVLTLSNEFIIIGAKPF